MSNFSRLVSLILGLFLITVAIAGFLDIQTGTMALRENLEYLSPREGVYKTVTPGGSIVTSDETKTPVVNYASATVAAAFTQLAVTTQTIIPTSTPLPQPNYPPPPPSYYPLTYTPQFVSLGVHIVQPGEYLFCIGRAYRVLPQAIAYFNDLPLEATLFVGQELYIPDAPWTDIPPGQICKPQFKTHYSLAPTFAYTPLANLIRVKPVNGEYRFVNYLIQNDKVKKSLPQQSPSDKIADPEPIAEIRTVRVDLPKQMRMGESSQVLLTFNPDTGQTSVSVTASPGEIPAAPTATREPNRVAYSSHPLVIPAVFDEFRVFSVARLDAAGFDYSPEGDVQQEISLGKQLTWRWSIKPRDAEPQELIIKLRLHFESRDDQNQRPDEEIWSDSFHVAVTKNIFQSLFGSQASIFTGFTFITGGILSIFSIWEKIRPIKKSTEAR